MIRNKIIAFIIAALISTSFLWITIFSGPSAFNIIPFEIHEAISPGGSSESFFIRVFDIAIAILLFILSYRIIYKMIIK